MRRLQWDGHPALMFLIIAAVMALLPLLLIYGSAVAQLLVLPVMMALGLRAAWNAYRKPTPAIVEGDKQAGPVENAGVRVSPELAAFAAFAAHLVLGPALVGFIFFVSGERSPQSTRVLVELWVGSSALLAFLFWSIMRQFLPNERRFSLSAYRGVFFGWLGFWALLFAVAVWVIAESALDALLANV